MRRLVHVLMDAELERSSLRLVVALALVLTAGMVWGIRWSGGGPASMADVPVAHDEGAVQDEAPARTAVPIFLSDGAYWGFISGGYLFDAGGEYVGWVEGGRVWHRSGEFLGEVVDGNYVLRDTMLMTAPMTNVSRTPPLSPLSATPPMTPLGRMIQMTRIGWVDALDKQ